MILKNTIPIYIRNKSITKDSTEGGSIVTYGTAYAIEATVYDQKGEQESNIYGKTLPLTKKLLIDKPFTSSINAGVERFTFTDGTYIQPADGVCLYAASTTSPDYEIQSINPVGHLQVVISKR